VNHPLQCPCGTLKGTVSAPQTANRVVCYCLDCQAFAHFLGRPADVLDERAGSEVVQVLPKRVVLSQGIEALACIRLTPNGLIRWYAGCCNTPVGNTLATPKISFIGLLHSCLQNSATSLDDSFGPVRAWLNTGGASGNPKPPSRGQVRTVFWFITTTVKARISGSYRQSPFFDAVKATPIVLPRVLSDADHTSLMHTARSTQIRQRATCAGRLPL
jgi:Family of unknown function (DUF6151)